MELLPFLKSMIDQDKQPVVICDTRHIVLYQNPAAMEDGSLVGKSIMDCHKPETRAVIQRVVDRFACDRSHDIVHTFSSEDGYLDGYMVALRDENGELIGYYEKHESRRADTSPCLLID